MGEFQREVEEIARHISHARRESASGKLRSGELEEIVNGVVGRVNCYPGEPGFVCCKKVYIFSLSPQLGGAGKPELKLDEAFDAMAKHCNGVCKRQTSSAILVTDNWDAAVFDAWRPTIENFDGVYFEAYLLNDDKVTRITL